MEKILQPTKNKPQPQPQTPPQILKNIGTDQKTQDTIFTQLINKDNYAYDLSAIFTRSTLNIAELRYNSQKRQYLKLIL
ncbi:MAG: hypothetical protein LBQ98_04885 [Nitrososphaerota archaeon]|jgi:hypothetical protein|nr:hypothetical protein [Nitrososphaerota archaeon]